MADDRYAQLEAYKAKLFPEFVCPECGRNGQPVVTAAGKDTPGFWCGNHYDPRTLSSFRYFGIAAAGTPAPQEGEET